MKPPLASEPTSDWSRNPWAWLGLGLLVVYIRGLFIDLMDIDASQYASVAMEMLRGGHWLQVQYRGADYLDKPPLLFWSSAASFALFGLHNWAYKLASLIAAAAGVYAVYRFSLLFYARTTARNAAFILAASVGAVLMCNDVRTDALLMGLATCAVWQAAEHLSSGRLGHLLLAGLFAGLAMLAKGPIGLIVPGFAVGSHLVLQRDWRRLVNPRWLAGLAVTAIVLLPMCWGLYQQFDLHPEKVVNGHTGVSGLYFFFWEQSFGRITGASVWKNNTTLFTFFHVYLWVFLPWPLLFAGALWRRFGDVVRDRFRLPAADEGYSLGGFALTFVALSLSHYKLPHYIFVTLPWASILTARWLAMPGGIGRAWWRLQYGVFGVLGALVLWLLLGVFPPGDVLVWAGALALFGYLFVLCWRDPFPPRTDALVLRSALAALATLLVVNFHFYPNLLPFQSTIAAPRLARQSGIPADKLAYFDRFGPAMDFYAGQTLPEMRTPATVRDAAAGTGPFWVYTDRAGRARLDSAAVRYTETAALQHFEVARLTGRFLNYRTRATALEPVFLLKILADSGR
jgi:4-amino-4-deoxy-L-arabinose transferase-like glycosyltransferase